MVLFLIAYVLLLPLTVVNYLAVAVRSRDHARGYFRSTAVNLDKFGNREFRTLWNLTLQRNGYEFGNERETISSALGKNERDGTLTKAGRVLAIILNTIDKNHCQKAIVEL